jgi:hypothetical protein
VKLLDAMNNTPLKRRAIAVPRVVLEGFETLGGLCASMAENQRQTTKQPLQGLTHK